MAAIQPLPESGEAAFEHGGRRYTLALNHLAWATAQRFCGTVEGRALSRPQILKRVAEGFEEEAYALFLGMLQRHHPQIVTLDEAAELMESAGVQAIEAIRIAMGLAAPDPKDVAELREGERPPTAQPQKRKRMNGKRISGSGSAD